MSVTPQQYYYLNDNRLDVTGLRDSAGVYLNSATVTTILIDATTLAEVAGETWPVTLDYVATSNGDYTAVLESALSVTPGQRLILRVTAVQGTTQAYWEIPVLVRMRQE